MKKIIFVLSAVIGLATFSSCDKEQDPIDVTKNAYLVERAWQLKSKVICRDIDAEVPSWEDLYTPMEPCEKDDYLYFASKSNGSKNDYFIKCSSSAPDYIDFFYSITDNDSYITVYTNPDDPGASVILVGKMETPAIDEFKVTHTYWNEATEKNEQLVQEYVLTHPTDI